MGIIKSLSEIESLVKIVNNIGGVYFVFVFSGFFVFWWRDDVCGVLVGIMRYINKVYIVWVILESMCY